MNNLLENIENREAKEKVAKKMAERVKDGEVIGFGSGTTAFLTAKEISNKIDKEKIKIEAIPASNQMEELCKSLNIPTRTLNEATPDWCFDGADEVDENNWLIKGRGAAMFREKLNIINSKENYILVDNSKFVKKLGEKNLVPVECYSGSITYVKKELQKLGAEEIVLRKEGENIVKTDCGNYILDVKFKEITEDLEKKVKEIVGVIESGLFINYDITIINI